MILSIEDTIQKKSLKRKVTIKISLKSHMNQVIASTAMSMVLKLPAGIQGQVGNGKTIMKRTIPLINLHTHLWTLTSSLKLQLTKIIPIEVIYLIGM